MNKLQNVQRFDIVGMSETVERTPQGFLKVPGFATRTGVFTYRDSEGAVRRELRHPDDVFDPESIATLKRAPVTLEHPPVMLDPTNVTQYIKGYSTERTDVNREMLETDLIVADREAMDAVEKRGVRELSAGYLADIIEESGTFNGAEYDYRQKNIKYNHIALVKRGRAGPEVRLRLDSADAVMVGGEIKTPADEFTPEGENDSLKIDADEDSTETVVVSGRNVEMPKWLAEIWNDMTDRYDQMRGQVQKTLEDTMKHDDKHKDADISQKNISPSVNVVQKAPDGRAASGKIGPADKMGPSRAKGDDEEEHGIVGGVKPNSRAAGGKALADAEEMKGVGDEEEHDDDEVPGDFKASQGFKEKGIGDKHKDFEGAGAASAAMSPADKLKHELEELEGLKKQKQDEYDALMAKHDEMAAASMGGGEHKMDSKGFRAAVRNRVKLERAAEGILPEATVAKFDSMSDTEIRAAVIKHRHPNADLAGKSETYLAVRFDSIVELNEGSKSVRREMGSSLLNRMDSEEHNPDAKRREMTAKSRDLWKQPLSASKQ